MVILISGVLLVAFWAAVRLLGFWPALLSLMMIALDPFYIAHSRLLHLDALLSSFILLALLSLSNYLYRGHHKRDLVISGIATGLACLTKSPALFLIPFTALLLLLDETGWKWSGLPRQLSVWRRLFANLLIWGSVALAVGVLLWPAMWVQPLQTIYFVLRAMAGHAAKGHEASIYFNGAVIDGDPGLHFYPVTYLWRASPFVLAGLVLVCGTIHKPRLMSPQERRVILSLALFALLYSASMTLGAKKWDRYLLPVYLPLDLVAALGWLAASRSLLAWQPRVARPILMGCSLLLLSLSLTTLLYVYPYYLSYYNPLLGGTVQAPAVMMIGWGEGLDQAAHFLNRQPDAETMTVASGIWTGSFSYFFKGRLKGTTFDPATSEVAEWSATDYLVIYINQWQRNRLSPELLDYLAKLTPVYRVQLQGLEYVRVYDLRQVPPPEYLLRAHRPVEPSVQRP
jgi:4-amino-4-deoxy-L-arabinose transferase-like glycosyltransferase